jgi:hypothetical protein
MRFPYLFTSRGITNVIRTVDLVAVPKTLTDDFDFTAGISVTQPDGLGLEDWPPNGSIAGLRGRSAAADVVVLVKEDEAQWTITIDEDAVSSFRGGVGDLLLACHYTVA